MTDNFSKATEITMQAYQQIAGNYGLQSSRQNQGSLSDFWREQLQHFIEMTQANPLYQANPALVVADIGCGPGRESLYLARKGFSVLAADLSEAMLTEARQRTQHEPKAQHITFRQMDMRHLDLPDASCAGLLASASFLHIPKRENLVVLQELKRVLILGGPLLLLVKEYDGGDDERYDLHEETGQLRFYARYRGGELWNLLEQVNLRVLAIETAIDSRFANLPRWLAALAVK